MSSRILVPENMHSNTSPHNNGGSKFFKQVAHPKINIHNWAQCEIIANAKTGVARMACCPLPPTATAATKCKAFEVLDFKDPKAGRVGPIAIQVHNGGIHDEYKNLYLETPVVDAPDKFITT